MSYVGTLQLGLLKFTERWVVFIHVIITKYHPCKYCISLNEQLKHFLLALISVLARERVRVS